MTSRRSFFSTLATAVAGFSILPPATTYARVWKAQRSIPNPDYVEAEYQVSFYAHDGVRDLVYNPKDFYGNWGLKLSDHPIRFQLDQGNVFRRVGA